ncbi:L,D-transpeptidase [Methylobacterium nodulans]|uniref:ErfK/YbiS/YcfS/YnhG family protein n=1 Tax=Methylobacterium nodulans (strain LMG 21967 / CNCM I-2342 / ORS 2060) TaxID=460265 RepID=B8IKN1_METNO|nr:L,D-transpeptidase [Methylobacterium nodulans]ACL56238.1 ErfK/YbiS/YcfS/YnhG family protein [Methylobacterium nodulans ORS 2060]
MRGKVSLAVALLMLAGPGRAAADVLVSVDKAAQRMTVSVDGKERYAWPVSTGASGYATPAGTFTPSRLVREHFSREWDDAPMPFSIFFTDAGHAIHGSRAVGRLGTPASHGCIRLAPANARTLFQLVQAEGLARTRIEVAGTEAIASAGEGAPGAPLDYRRLTSFNPLTMGIIAGEPAVRLRTP